MDIFELVLANVVSLSAVGAGLGWLLKQYLDRRLEHHFFEKEQRVAARVRLLEKYDDHRREVTLEVFPRINEIVYRTRNLVRDAPEPPSADDVEELQEAWNEIADLMYRHQLYLPERLFETLHRYKRQLQAAVLYLASRSSDTARDPDADDRAIRARAVEDLTATQKRATELFREIVSGEGGFRD